jgi:hypothetical protein
VPLKFEELVAVAVQGGGGGGVEPQDMLLGEKVIGTVESVLVNVADPERVQLPVMVQVPEAVSVGFEVSGVKIMLPGTVVVPLSQVEVTV